MNGYITRPTVKHIELTSDAVNEALLKLKSEKASGPDEVAPKLLRLVVNSSAPSLMPVFIPSVSTNTVPKMWKSANVFTRAKTKLIN